ncbi:MAG: RNA polymerase-associated protein RapA, partial [bacterium]
IRLSDGSTHTVIEFTEISGRRFYRAENSAGAVGEFDELDLDSFMRFSKPQDRLLAGQIDKLSKFALRVETLNNQFRVRQSVVHGLAGPRVQLLPHQLYIAQQVSERFAPRVLLADEVGLGKTIEAGLVVHRQLLTGRASRVLILVPDSLAFQWLVEMRRRFNLRFSLIDSADIFSGTEGVGDAEGEENELDAEEISPENPFDQSQLFICPISRLTANDALAQFCLASDWDLLLVDEAHHLTWSPESASPAYTLVEKLAARARGVLLLTATPEQLGVAGHFARLRLLDPDRYYDLQAFIDEETDYAEIGDLVLSLSDLRDSDAEHLPDLLQARLIELLGNEKTADLLESLSTSGVDADQGSRRDSAIRDAQDALLDRHGTGRVLFRNTRSNVGGFPKRELVTHPLIQPAFFEQKSSGASVEQLLHPESLMSGDSWLRDDPRVGWLVNLLKQKRTDKFLLICARAETAIALENYLRLRQGTQSAVFHEGMDLVSRDRAAAYFADTELGAQLLVCSEIGSEGRNFQFSHNLICFDLPLNPDLLEQRIGRLDRIGQTETVRIHVPFYEHSAQHRLMSWYHRGMNAFESVCPVGANVSALHGEALIECLKDDLGDRFDRLLEETASYTGDLLNQLHDGRDRLLEMNSCRPDKAAAIIEDVIENARPLEFTDYIERLF